MTGQIILTAAGGWPSTTSGCSEPTKVEYGTNDVDMYHMDFSATAKEYAQWNVGMPSDWDAGTVTGIFYWTAAAGAAGNVIWGLQGIAYGDNDAIDAAWGAAQEVTDAWIANGDEHITSATASITLAGTPAAGEDVQFRAYRDGAAGGDTMVNDARLIKIRVTFTRT